MFLFGLFYLFYYLKVSLQLTTIFNDPNNNSKYRDVASLSSNQLIIIVILTCVSFCRIATSLVDKVRVVNHLEHGISTADTESVYNCLASRDIEMTRSTEVIKGVNFSHSTNATVGPTVAVAPQNANSRFQVLYEVLPIAVIIVIVNSVVFFLFVKSKRLRTPTNCLLLSLAVCDIMNGLVCIPLFIVVVLKVVTQPNQHLGNFNVIFNNCVAMSAAYHILAITLERYFCIKRPFVHRQLTKKSMLKVALLVWFVALIIGFMPYAWYSLSLTDYVAYQKTQVGYVAFCLTFVFLVPCILIVASQTVMFKAIAKSGGQGLTATKAAQRKAKNDKKCLVIFALMAIIYVVCWLPWFILSLYYSFWFIESRGDTMEKLISVTQWVVIFRYITSIVNPLLYTFFKRDFLEAFKLLILKRRSRESYLSSSCTSRKVHYVNSQQRKLIAPSNGRKNSEEIELETVV